MEDVKQNDKTKKPIITNTQDELLPGTLIFDGKYRILGKIGDGGMATVYKAVRNIDNEIVAIKLNKANFRTEREYESFVSNFRNEVNNIASLNNLSKYVIKLYDWDVNKNSMWLIVLEYVGGGTLNDLLKGLSVFSLKEMQYYFGQIIDALIVAHKNGIIHRDIKPENIFLTEIGEVRLGDFGISFTSENSKEAKKKIGTPKFMPPELISNASASKQSDIYSLGVVMYIAATGTAPFVTSKTSEKGREDLFIKHVSQSPIRPSSVNPDIPNKLSNLILKMIEKSPNDRPASMEYVYRELMSPDVNLTAKLYHYKGRRKFFLDQTEPKQKWKSQRAIGYSESRPYYLRFRFIILWFGIFFLTFSFLILALVFAVIK
ncbi:serine/threonine-protein kinase [Spiroplasma endosymbiont of Aspidapion aeneum]|uniref:serine/threonine-protein kinase n=1 Tax=Spiroplasma endosymbiont of Aspidapion aeneum TaxID=3066276 RepID=UPI00313B96B4